MLNKLHRNWRKHESTRAGTCCSAGSGKISPNMVTRAFANVLHPGIYVGRNYQQSRAKNYQSSDPKMVMESIKSNNTCTASEHFEFDNKFRVWMANGESENTGSAKRKRTGYHTLLTRNIPQMFLKRN